MRHLADVRFTDEQLSAVEATGDRVYVQAGPGSGKTLTLAARVARLLRDQGVAPEQICVLTFTRAACAELRDRISLMAGPVADDVGVYTFHEAALRHGPPLGGMQVATGHESHAAVRSLYVGPMRRPPSGLPPRTQLLEAITAWEAVVGPVDHVGNVRVVRQRLQEAGLVPTWDLVPRFITEPGPRRYEHVLVDEAQDTTPNESVVAFLLSDGGSVFAVGDPRQAIMGWRGAAPGLWGVPTHQLTRTFRFGLDIAMAANRLGVGHPIAAAGRRSAVIDLTLEDLADFAERRDGTAILTRTHTDAAAIERLLPMRARHVTRDPMDPLATPADRIAEISARGLIPVLTVHAAKGREWDRVIVVGPSTIKWGREGDAEERRVLYVAATRARQELIRVFGEEDHTGYLQWRIRSCGWGPAAAVGEEVPMHD